MEFDSFDQRVIAALAEVPYRRFRLAQLTPSEEKRFFRVARAWQKNARYL